MPTCRDLDPSDQVSVVVAQRYTVTSVVRQFVEIEEDMHAVFLYPTTEGGSEREAHTGEKRESACVASCHVDCSLWRPVHGAELHCQGPCRVVRSLRLHVPLWVSLFGGGDVFQ